MTAYGAFTFVLHTHLPYARLAGRWPHGEEWIHEAASETYVPLLTTLYDLKEEGVQFKLTIGITPVLAEQLSDDTVLFNFVEYLDNKIEASKNDVAIYSTATSTTETTLEGARENNEHLGYLASWYQNYYETVKSEFLERFNRDIIGAFRQLQDEGYIDIITCAATHGYLPLLATDSAIRGQIQTGVASYERLFGRRPRGIWLPECAYRPAYVDDEGNIRPGIESFLREQGIGVFFVETHTITGGQPVGIAAGDVIGPYGNIKRRYVIPSAKTPTIPARAATTFKAYYVSETMEGAQAEQHSGVAVIGRNNSTGQQVWSAEWGYPGDFDYREFHKKAGTSGLQYWRVTGDKVDLGHKDYYHPDWAEYKVEQHAEHFSHLVGDLLRAYHKQTGEYGLISSNYDTELFGHWWFEGVAWLGKVLRHLANHPSIDLTSACDFIEQHPPQEVLHLPESSWGAGGNHFTWDNGDTNWMWGPIHECEGRMKKLANQYDDPSEDERTVLSQAAREALLLQSSDWPFLVTTGQAREYAIQRFSEHVERFNRLALSLEEGKPDVGFAVEMWERDKVFPNINYKWFS